MPGAVAMAAEAALRSGAGMVTVATHPEHAAPIIARTPEVMVVDANGRVHILDYQMVQLENGWKINGVQLLGNSDPSA